MISISILTELSECKKAWKSLVSVDNVTDLWEFRECFHKNFNRPLKFIVAKEGRRIVGLLPLSWIEENQHYGYFPGETCEGKTWLEQNKIIAETPEIADEIIKYLQKTGEKYHLRYMSHSLQPSEIDEINYSFSPPKCDYKIEEYYKTFSSKSIRKIIKEIDMLKNLGVEIRMNDLSDFDKLVEWNINRYGKDSYFADERLRNSFKEAMKFLNNNGMLRLTTILLNGHEAAIDLGCVFNKKYTLLIGGTNKDFPGVAKLINLHHINVGCKEKFDEVNFLCGDFSWKARFNLSEKPLYVLSNCPKQIKEECNILTAEIH